MCSPWSHLKINGISYYANLLIEHKKKQNDYSQNIYGNAYCLTNTATATT